MSSTFERTDSETLLEGKFFSVRRETFRHEDGEDAERDIVMHTGAVGIVVLDGERLWLVRQPREATGEFDLLELPAGKLDAEGETPEETARRELAEEIGKAAEHWEHLTTFYTSPGFTDEQCHVFLATGLRDAPGQEIEGERIDDEVQPRGELDELIGAARDSKTLIGLLLLRDRLRAGA